MEKDSPTEMSVMVSGRFLSDSQVGMMESKFCGGQEEGEARESGNRGEVERESASDSGVGINMR